jgi:hypothetical protein
MNASSRTRPNAVTLTASALLGLGMLAGCTSGGNRAAPPTATTSAARATPAASLPAMSAARLLSAAQAAVRAGGSVHVDIASQAPNNSVTYSDDATGNGGRQVITFNGTGHATILLIGGVDYVQADAQALHGFFEAPLAQAEQAAGRWISVRPGQKLGTSTYDDVTAGITLSSVATELAVGNPLSKAAPATVAGQPVIGVQAPLPASDGLPGAKLVLYVADDSALRPVRYELVGAGSTQNTISFSRWGERLSLTAPPNAIPASSLTAGSVTV